MSIMEMSHRSAEYEAINNEAETRLKRLLDLGDDYRVLFLQGGASLQFAMVPMNFLHPGMVADYLLTDGSWSERAYEEARLIGEARIAGSTKEEEYRRIPATDEITLSENPAYVHLTSNNTIYGTQWHTYPEVGERSLIADMSSDILSRPFNARQFGLIYAGAQKNLGPSGVTVVIIRNDLLAKAAKNVPTMLRYSTHAKNNSLYNTPPVFGVYVLNLVLGWIESTGGLAQIGQINQQKAQVVYDSIDRSGEFYRGHAQPDSRSLMNITFRLPDEALEKQFVKQAKDEGMIGLGGHRSVGGVRASLYNAMTLEGSTALANFMDEFLRQNS
jgi:phosphoserine aminotransferase